MPYRNKQMSRVTIGKRVGCLLMELMFVLSCRVVLFGPWVRKGGVERWRKRSEMGVADDVVCARCKLGTHA